MTMPARPKPDTPARRVFTADQSDLLRVLVVLAGVVIAASVASRGVLLAPQNIANVFQQNAVLFVIAMAQFIVVLTGGIDLSIGAVVALSSVLFVGFLDYGSAAATAVALAGGAAVGLTNGLLVTTVRLPSFVTSLGVMQIVYSLAKVFTGGGTITNGLGGATLPGFIASFYASSLLGVPLPVIVFAVMFAAVALYLRGSLGYFLYAIGSNARAARLAGIKVSRTRIAAYVVASSIAAVGGILFTARVGYGDPQAGVWLPMDSIAAVSIGGASLTGGRGTLYATIAGVLIIAVLNNAMNLFGVPATLQPTVKGAIIIVTVLIYSRRSEA
jgi:ribose transport system permease protein